MRDGLQDGVVSDGGHDDHVYLDSENKFYDYDAAAGLPLWLDGNTLCNLFAFRYDSPAFNDQYLQEDYRESVHRDYSDLIKDLIKTRIELERSKVTGRPPMDGDDKIYDDKIIDSGNVLEIAVGVGLNPKRIPVATIKEDVISSLEDMFTKLIRERPGMSTDEKEESIDFVDGQLWNDDAQSLWRCVTAEVLADLYSYDELPDGVKIIDALNDYAMDDLKNGLHQSMDLANVNMGEILNDDVVRYVISTVDANRRSKQPEPVDWVIQEALSDVIDGSDDGDY